MKKDWMPIRAKLEANAELTKTVLGKEFPEEDLQKDKYPLSKDVCQVMLKMKLLDGKMNEVCYKLLKMIEKQAGVKK
ncbi:hypothetical protein Tco_0426054 [Tanacetum coccineum]